MTPPVLNVLILPISLHILKLACLLQSLQQILHAFLTLPIHTTYTAQPICLDLKLILHSFPPVTSLLLIPTSHVTSHRSCLTWITDLLLSAVNTIIMLACKLTWPVDTYSSETWTLTAKGKNNLRIFERQILKKINEIPKMDKEAA